MAMQLPSYGQIMIKLWPTLKSINSVLPISQVKEKVKASQAKYQRHDRFMVQSLPQPRST